MLDGFVLCYVSDTDMFYYMSYSKNIAKQNKHSHHILHFLSERSY
jgi:hypothetical protein